MNESESPTDSRQLLTAEEKRAVVLAGELFDAIHPTVGHGPARERDLAEFLYMVHNIQARSMGQAAARAYPEEFRLLGKTVKRIRNSEAKGGL